MPYMIVPRNGKYYVHKRGADGQPEGRAFGKHDDDAGAQAQLAVLESAYARERDSAAKYAGIDMRPPANVVANAKRGLASGGGAKTPRALAEQIASGQSLTARTVRVMARRTIKGDESDPAYLMCGGNAGAVWARSVCQKLDEADSMKRTKAVKDFRGDVLQAAQAGYREGVQGVAGNEDYHRQNPIYRQGQNVPVLMVADVWAMLAKHLTPGQATPANLVHVRWTARNVGERDAVRRLFGLRPNPVNTSQIAKMALRLIAEPTEEGWSPYRRPRGRVLNMKWATALRDGSASLVRKIGKGVPVEDSEWSTLQKYAASFGLDQKISWAHSEYKRGDMARALTYLKDARAELSKKLNQWAKEQEAMQTNKTLNVSDAGSVGFGVGAEDEGVAARAATAKYRKGSRVVVKALNQRGTVVSVRPLKSGRVLYGVKTTDGIALATAGELAGAGAGTAKGKKAGERPQIEADLSRAHSLLLQGVNPNSINAAMRLFTPYITKVNPQVRDILMDAQSSALAALSELDEKNTHSAIQNSRQASDYVGRAYTRLYRQRQAESVKPPSTASAKAADVVARFQARQKAAITPYKQVIDRAVRQAAANSKTNEKGIGIASGDHAGAKVKVRYHRKVGDYTIQVESAEGQSHTFTSRQMLNATQFMAGNINNSTMSAGKTEDIPETPTPTTAAKALADAVTQVTDPAQTDAIDDAFEVVRTVTHATGDSNAIKAVVDLEATVFAHPVDDVAAWREGVLAKIAAYEQTVKAMEAEQTPA